MFNESGTIKNVLYNLSKVPFPACVDSYEIIIVDDCSTDNSVQIVNDLIINGNTCKLVKHDINQGKGAAVRTGLKHAQGDVYLIQDADSELSPNDIPLMINAMDQLNVDFVNGSRYLPGPARPLYSYKRYLGNKFFTFLTSALINVKLTDMACGYKLFRKELYDKLVLQENRFGFEAELLIKALHIKRNNITEVPVQYFPRNIGEGKKLGRTDALKILLTVFRYGLGEKLKKTQFKGSRIASVIIAIVMFWMVFNQKFWNDEGRIISWDIISYYAYLPATFIYNDVTLKFKDTYKGPHKFVFWPETAPNGGKVIKTSMGMSFLYSPFFFMGHAAAYLLGYDTGGFSPPYRFFIVLSSIFYLLIGLHYLRKILQQYFSQWITFFTMLLIALTTPLLIYVTVESAMPHTYNFALFSMFIYYTIKWHKSQTLFNTCVIGILAGVISLIRPTNAIVMLIFLMYDLKKWSDFKIKWNLFIKNYAKILLIGALILLIWLPQMIYWKKVTGQWMYFSYGKERFFFDKPQIILGLFGFRKGLFIYTPLMILAFSGIPLLFKYRREYSWLIIVFMAINIYVIYSWWAWWYGWCFSSRPFIDYFAVMAIPLALLLHWIVKQNVKLRIIGVVLVLLIGLEGIHLSVEAYYGAIHGDSMTKAAFFDSFWRIRASEKFPALLEKPDYDKAIIGIQATNKP